MTFAGLALAWLLLPGFASTPVPLDPASHGAALLAQAKTAMGGPEWDKIHLWHEVGIIESPGHEDAYESYADFCAPRFIGSHGERGVLKKVVFDGKTFWFFTGNHIDESITDSNRIKGARLAAYIAHYGYFFPDRFHASMTYSGERSARGHTYDVVHIVPDDAQGVYVWIDKQTHYIAGYADLEGQAISTSYSDYRQMNNLAVPFKAQNGDATTVITTRVDLEPDNAALFVVVKP